MRCRKSRIILLLALTIIVFSVTVVGQSRKRRYSKIPPRMNAKPIMLPDFNEPMQVSIVKDGMMDLEGNPLYLWSSYIVYKEDKERYYLGLPDEESFEYRLAVRLGWVDKNFVIDSPGALRTENKIYRKVIVFDNTPDNRVSIYASPDEGSEELLKAPLFSFFYIFKETESHFLVGVAAQTEVEVPDSAILGWIKRESCQEWNTRQAVNYALRTRKDRIQMEALKKEDPSKSQGFVRLYKDIESLKKTGEENVLAMESEEDLWRYNIMRYPLLESKSIDGKRVFRIAFLGGAGSGKTQRMISKMKEKKDQLNKIDIMIVMDRSCSELAREEVLNALRQEVDRFRTSRESFDLAFAVTFYDDFKVGKRYRFRRGKLFQPKVVKISSFSDDLNDLERVFRKTDIADFEDDGQALYYGIDSAMSRRVRWRPGSRRHMILVGTSGNHPQGNRNVSRLTVSDVIEVLNKNEIRFHALQLLPAPESQKNLRYNDYYNQISRMLERVDHGSYIPTFPGGSFEELKHLYLGTVVSGICEEIRSESELLSRAMSFLIKGFPLEETVKHFGEKWKETWHDFSDGALIKDTSRKNPDLEKSLREFCTSIDVDLEELKASGRETYFEQGWVWEYHPQTNLQQIQVCLLIDKGELSRLLGFIHSLAIELKKASRPEQYLEIWKTLLKTTFGIDDFTPSEPIETLITQHTGLPFMNGVLNYTLDDFVKNARNSAFRKKIINRLDRTYGNLFRIISENETEEVQQKDGRITVEIKKRWWTEEGNASSYSWVEIERFP